MFWLVDMRLHFYFAAMDLFLGLGYSDYICTCQAKRHAQDQRNAGKVELESGSARGGSGIPYTCF